MICLVLKSLRGTIRPLSWMFYDGGMTPLLFPVQWVDGGEGRSGGVGGVTLQAAVTQVEEKRLSEEQHLDAVMGC